MVLVNHRSRLFLENTTHKHARTHTHYYNHQIDIYVS